MILLEFRDFYTKGRGTDCKAAVRALTGVTIVLLVIETHHLKEEEEEEETENVLNVRRMTLSCKMISAVKFTASIAEFSRSKP